MQIRNDFRHLLALVLANASSLFQGGPAHTLAVPGEELTACVVLRGCAPVNAGACGSRGR